MHKHSQALESQTVNCMSAIAAVGVAAMAEQQCRFADLV